jgi:hypothetical protein
MEGGLVVLATTSAEAQALAGAAVASQLTVTILSPDSQGSPE